MATPGKEKNMSSRLLTMKFMQRAASGSQSAPSTPESRPSKRPRLSEPSSRVTSDRSDQQKVQDALAEEERKRQQALERQAADAGDTKWQLSSSGVTRPKGFNVISAGYSQIDLSRNTNTRQEEVESEDDSSRPGLSGRKSFGKFNKTLEKQQNRNGKQDESSDSESDSENQSEDGEISDGEDGLEKLRRKPSVAADEARAKRKAKRKAEKQDLEQQSERRRNKQVKLNTLTSISGGGGSRSTPSKSPMKCFICGSEDHKKNECPRKRR